MDGLISRSDIEAVVYWSTVWTIDVDLRASLPSPNLGLNSMKTKQTHSEKCRRSIEQSGTRGNHARNAGRHVRFWVSELTTLLSLSACVSSLLQIASSETFFISNVRVNLQTSHDGDIGEVKRVSSQSPELEAEMQRHPPDPSVKRSLAGSIRGGKTRADSHVNGDPSVYRPLHVIVALAVPQRPLYNAFRFLFRACLSLVSHSVRPVYS